MERLLIDECLSQGLVALAKARGIAADHVVWLGEGGVQDWNLVAFAIDRDYTLVTNNRRDFLKHYAELAMHDGLIIVVPMVERADQIRLFGLAMDVVASLPDTVNTLVEVFSDGEVRTRDWFSLANEPGYVKSTGRTP